ncbi:kinesin-like protein KIF18B [Podargus strigoides]
MALGAPPEEGTVAVVVRVRPLVPCERARAAPPILHVVDQHVLVFDPEEPGGPLGSVLPARGPRRQGKDLKFVFDRVFEEGATQEEVFQHTTHDMLDSVLNGYNCSVFAYGATGAGKTYTMLGSEKSPGIMYLTVVELYKRIEARKAEKSCEVLISYQEVYNEQIHDLLEPKGPLAIREDPKKGVVVQGLSIHQPASAEQLLEMLAKGNKNRTQHPTDANATSSRSHAICQVYVKQQNRAGVPARDLQVAKMSLIDLAGSERASVTNAKGERLREGASINRSLLALINVINALADMKSKKGHIPYRDSKLTRLLKDSLGGNCRTVMIAAVSPSALAYEDTYNTLKYASRAKEIKLALKSKVQSLDSHTCKYTVICRQLEAEVAGLRARLRAYEDAAREAENQALVPLPPSSPVCPREGKGEQQELGAGQPAQLQSEEAPKEMPPSSPSATQQTDLQLEPEEPSCFRPGLSHGQRETLIAAILSVAQKQHSLLKAANLLTPSMAAEFEEVERLVHQKGGVKLEQGRSQKRRAEVSGASPAQRMQQDCDEVSVAVPTALVTSTTPQCLLQLALRSPPAPVASSGVMKRRRSEQNISQSGTLHRLQTPVKRQRRGGKEAETLRATQSPGPPCLKAAASVCCVSQGLSYSTPKTGCVPLLTLAAQNCCTLPTPVHILNVTYECVDSGSPQPVNIILPEFSMWENVQGLPKQQDGPFMPKAGTPLFGVRASSISKASSLSRASVQKWRRVESIVPTSLDVIQRCIPRVPHSSRSCALPSCAPAAGFLLSALSPSPIPSAVLSASTGGTLLSPGFVPPAPWVPTLMLPHVPSVPESLKHCCPLPELSLRPGRAPVCGHDAVAWRELGWWWPRALPGCVPLFPAARCPRTKALRAVPATAGSSPHKAPGTQPLPEVGPGPSPPLPGASGEQRTPKLSAHGAGDMGTRPSHGRIRPPQAGKGTRCPEPQPGCGGRPALHRPAGLEGTSQASAT